MGKKEKRVIRRKKRIIMEKKKVIDKRSIKLANMFKPGYIPFLSGRPVRETVIGKDDLMNLEIVLNTTNTIEEFVRKI